MKRVSLSGSPRCALCLGGSFSISFAGSNKVASRTNLTTEDAEERGGEGDHEPDGPTTEDTEREHRGQMKAPDILEDEPLLINSTVEWIVSG